jgi:signal transduction histidine kinase
VTGLVRPLTSGQKAFDAVLAVLALGLSGLLAVGTGYGDLVGVFAALLYAAAVALRRWVPWAMVVLATLASLIQLLDTSVNAGSVLVLVFLFATTGSDPDKWIRRAGLAAVVIASVGAGVAGGTVGFPTDSSDADLRSGFVVAAETAAVAGSACLIGFVRYQSRLAAEARVGEQIARIELAHEQERTRIARDMHDVVAHTLAVVVAQAEGARYAMKQRPESASDALRTIAETCRDSLGDTRRLLGELRGDATASTETAGEDALLERMRLAGLQLDVSDVGVPRPLAEPNATTLHWVLTEALTNALKHGITTDPVTVTRTWGDQLELTVCNAVGRDASVLGDGHGLNGIAERVRLADGTAEHRIEGHQFVLRVRLSYDGRADA